MKQYTTKKQWNELSSDDQGKVIRWCRKKGILKAKIEQRDKIHMGLSIGEMIDFLVVMLKH